MVRLVFLGLIAAAFFCSTFVLNRAMATGGGHWVWTASLRYAYVIIFLSVWIVVRSGFTRYEATIRLFRQHWRFWVVAGTIGFGIFYAPLCFAAAYAPGWIVAATWQLTILWSPVILWLFGRTVPWRAVTFTTLVFIGVTLINVQQAAVTSLSEVLLGTLPVVLAAFAYPVGNQLVKEATQGTHKRVTFIISPIMHQTEARILMTALGSVPFWLVMIVLAAPGLPTTMQLKTCALVALFTGCIATSLFYYARHLASTAYEIAAVDATQAGEVPITVLAEMLFFAGTAPSPIGVLGILAIVVGMALYTMYSVKSE